MERDEGNDEAALGPVVDGTGTLALGRQPVGGSDGHGGASGKATESMNFLFHSNAMASVPDGDYIDSIHERWYYDYRRLESHHGYIQWLFPIFKGSSANPSAVALSYDEAALIRQDIQCAFRVLLSYKMMLNFYGVKLVNVETGELTRTEEWKDRYHNMNILTHNNLRMSRIFASLGQLGFGRYKKPLFQHFHKEIMENGEIPHSKAPLNRVWKELVMDEDSAAYRANTKERGPHDRQESIFFTHLANESDEWKDFLARERELLMMRDQWKRQAQDKEKRKQEIKNARITGQQRTKRGEAAKRAAIPGGGQGKATPVGQQSTSKAKGKRKGGK